MIKKGFGFLILFALPFAAVGVGFGAWMGWTVIAHLKMRGWEEVPAKIVRADLKVNKGKTATYEVSAQYTYQYGNKKYTGTRVSFYGSDNIGSFHQDVYRKLSECRKSGKPFHCYVDPQRPDEAILFRDLRWEMLGFQSIFVLIFGGAGFGILTACLLGRRKARVEAALAAAHPDEPWLWKQDWAEGKVVSSNHTAMMFSLAFAALWNVISAPLLFVLPGEVLGKGNWLALIGVIFPIVGLGLIVWATYSVLRWRKFGQSVFQMASVPGVIGGQIAGVVRTSAKVLPEDGFRITLNCINRVTTGSGKSRSTSEHVLWQDDQVVGRDLLQNDPDHTAIPVLFAIPYECRPTDETAPDNQIIWRLAAKAKVPGVDYSAAFDVPVFKTAESNANFVADSSVMAEYALPPNPERDLHDAGVYRQPSPSGEGFKFTFPMGRNPGSALALSAFWLLLSGMVVVLIYLQAPLFFPIVFGLFDVLLLLFVADMWFYKSAVDVSPQGLSVTGGLFGLGKTHWVDASDVAKIEPVQGMQSGQTAYYNIVVAYGAGKQITIGKRTASHRLATAVIGQIEQAMHKQ
ncbi:MAG: DUF3592 domain-containing protein [Thermoguttaceae bacterium]|jgi:hypothetical protein